MQEFPLSLLLPAVHTEPPAFTTAHAEVCAIMALNKEHKEHDSFFQIAFFSTKQESLFSVLKKSYRFAALYMVFV